MKIIESNIIPLPRKDIDTDLIIPADFLTTTTKDGLGKHLFDRLRKMEPDFPLNQEKYRNCKILVTRDNFGCGSSREHAAWALKDWGIEIVLAPSFANIFHTNALNNGILPIEINEASIEQMFLDEQKNGSFKVKVDLPNQKVFFENGEQFNFEIEPFKKTCLIEGMDDLDFLINSKPEIAEFEKNHKKNIFFDISKA